MGCGASRFDAPCCKAKTTRINHRLHHRIEELKRRRRARSLNKVTPSKKVLLRHHSDVEDVGEIISENSTHSRQDIEKPSEKIEDLTLKLNEKNVTFIKGGFEGNVGDNAEEEGSIDDERRKGNNDGFFPGSPSFRIYYIESVVDDKKKDQSDEENQQLKESTNYARNVAQSELAETLKDSTTMAEKKGRKLRGFAKNIMRRNIRCY